MNSNPPCPYRHKLSARGCRASIEGHRGILEVKFRPDVEVHEIFLEAKISGSRGSRGAPDEKYLAPEFIELFPENASRIFFISFPLDPAFTMALCESRDGDCARRRIRGRRVDVSTWGF